MSGPHEDDDAIDAATSAPLIDALVAQSSDAIALVARGRIQKASRALAELLAFDSSAELIGQPASALATPEDAAILESALVEGGPRVRELRARRRDGSLLPIRASVAGPERLRAIHVRDASPGPTNALYRAMFEVNSAVKLLIDPTNARIVDANAAAVELYGWSLDELRAMRITEINTLDPDVVHEQIHHALAIHRTFFRFEHRTKSGDVRHVEVHTGPVRIEGRDLLLSIVHDVTERDAFEEQLRRAQRLETVGRLAGGVAHDFNNLLTIMTGSCALIARQLPELSAARPHLDDLSQTIERAASLTRQLLTLGSRQVMRKRTLELAPLIRSMERLLRQTAGARIALHIELGDAPPVHADPGQLEQVILNLVLNARDAMSSGGTLTIATGTRVVGPEGAPGLAPGRYAVLTVRDTGEGMDEATRAQIFDPFFTTRSESGGTGLGLSMVYGIVTQSEGQIDVQSERGRGSTFAVHLPASSAPVHDEGSRGPRRDAHEIDGEPLVALVEDEADLRRVLAEALEMCGFRVRAFASGDEVLRWAEREIDTLSALITDVVMPGTTGIEVARAVRELRPALPIVVVSGDMREHARLPPDVVFLQKPFAVDDLVRALRAAAR